MRVEKNKAVKELKELKAELKELKEAVDRRETAFKQKRLHNQDAHGDAEVAALQSMIDDAESKNAQLVALMDEDGSAMEKIAKQLQDYTAELERERAVLKLRLAEYEESSDQNLKKATALQLELDTARSSTKLQQDSMQETISSQQLDRSEEIAALNRELDEAARASGRMESEHKTEVAALKKQLEKALQKEVNVGESGGMINGVERSNKQIQELKVQLEKMEQEVTDQMQQQRIDMEAHSAEHRVWEQQLAVVIQQRDEAGAELDEAARDIAMLEALRHEKNTAMKELTELKAEQEASRSKGAAVEIATAHVEIGASEAKLPAKQLIPKLKLGSNSLEDPAVMSHLKAENERLHACIEELRLEIAQLLKKSDQSSLRADNMGLKRTITELNTNREAAMVLTATLEQELDDMYNHNQQLQYKVGQLTELLVKGKRDGSAHTDDDMITTKPKWSPRAKESFADKLRRVKTALQEDENLQDFPRTALRRTPTTPSTARERSTPLARGRSNTVAGGSVSLPITPREHFEINTSPRSRSPGVVLPANSVNDSDGEKEVLCYINGKPVYGETEEEQLVQIRSIHKHEQSAGDTVSDGK